MAIVHNPQSTATVPSGVGLCLTICIYVEQHCTRHWVVEVRLPAVENAGRNGMFAARGRVRIERSEALMSDYRIEPDGTVVVLLTEKATNRAVGPKPAVGARLAFKTKSDTVKLVKAGEEEGFTFDGKEFLAA